MPSAIVLSESETLLSTGLGFGAASVARYEWGRTYADSAKYAAAAATAMIIIDLMTAYLPEPFKSLATQLSSLDSCDPRIRAYRNGKTFDQSRQEARQVAGVLVQEIAGAGEVSWSRVLEASGRDEIVYKLTLKYLRLQGYDIGNFQTPRIRPG